MDKINLTKMRAGTRGIVVKVDGGRGLVKRLDALGIRSGTKITKVSSQLMRGPVTIALGNTRVAIGFGMARKIIIELEQ